MKSFTLLFILLGLVGFAPVAWACDTCKSTTTVYLHHKGVPVERSASISEFADGNDNQPADQWETNDAMYHYVSSYSLVEPRIITKKVRWKVEWEKCIKYADGPILDRYGDRRCLIQFGLREDGTVIFRRRKE